MKSKNNSLVNHNSKILNESPSGIRQILPGQIIRFKYTGSTKDPQPLVLTLFLEENKLLHCVNLNYMPEEKIQQLFRMLASKYGVATPDKKGRGNKIDKYSQISMPAKGGGLKSQIGRDIYRTIVKPILIENYNCYKTYTITKISGLRLVEYDMDIVKSGMSRVSIKDVQSRMKNVIGGEVSKQQGNAKKGN